MFENKEVISIDEYNNMIKMKTGYMIGLCSHLGALCSGADFEIQDKMKEYGLEIGKAYQIQDDYMEIYSNQETMKKSLNSDIELNKKTYMICLASGIAYKEIEEILNANELSVYDKTQRFII